METFTNSNLTVTFVWDGPQGSGPEAIVDMYAITIYPAPLSPAYVRIMIPMYPQSFDATLRYNTMYRAEITALNCAGESEPFIYPGIIEYGTYYYQ